MNRHDFQLNWILTKQWLPSEVLIPLLAESAHPDEDLSEVLVKRGLINRAQGEELAEATRRQFARPVLVERGVAAPRTARFSREGLAASQGHPSPTRSLRFDESSDSLDDFTNEKTTVIDKEEDEDETRFSVGPGSAPTHEETTFLAEEDLEKTARASIETPPPAPIPRTLRPSSARLRAVPPRVAAASDTALALPKGGVFGSYSVEEEIGQGSMGRIYKARHGYLKIPVALKILHSSNPRPEEAARFQREAQVLAQLRHPHICRVSDFGVHGGRPFIAMDFVEGPTLKDIVRESLRLQGRVPPFRKIARYLASIAEALSYCHAQGIIHRDVKPANILVESPHDRPVLIDFGIVKKDPTRRETEIQGLSKGLSASKEIRGTPYFMSPEQIDRKKRFGALSTAADVWSFGATLFYCLTGEPPYPSTSRAQLFTEILTHDPPSASRRNSSVPGWLNDICADCLQRQAADRPSLDLVAQHLRKGLSERRPRRRSLSWLAFGFLLLSAAAIGFFSFIAIERFAWPWR